MRCGFLFSKSGMLFVIIGLWFFCGLFFRFYNFKLEKFKCQTYRSHVRPCGLRGLCGLRGMLLSHTPIINFSFKGLKKYITDTPSSDEGPPKTCRNICFSGGSLDIPPLPVFFDGLSPINKPRFQPKISALR